MPESVIFFHKPHNLNFSLSTFHTFFIKFSFDGTSNSSFYGFNHLTGGNIMMRAQGVGHIHV